jgi:ankyrin repeat protein
LNIHYQTTGQFTGDGLCVLLGDEYAVRFLVENGADVNVVLPANRQTPLHLAALHKSSFSADSDGTDSIAKVTQLLLQRGANTNAQDSDSRFVLTSAFVLVVRVAESSAG